MEHSRVMRFWLIGLALAGLLAIFSLAFMVSGIGAIQQGDLNDGIVHPLVSMGFAWFIWDMGRNSVRAVSIESGAIVLTGMLGKRTSIPRDSIRSVTYALNKARLTRYTGGRSLHIDSLDLLGPTFHKQEEMLKELEDIAESNRR